MPSFKGEKESVLLDSELPVKSNGLLSTEPDPLTQS